MVLNREEFKQWVVDNLMHSDEDQKFVDDNSPLWEPEKSIGKKCSWFVMSKPIRFSYRYFRDGRGNPKGQYWAWCNSILQGKVGCFLSNDDDKIEWWGFTNKEDIEWWILKWG